MIPGASGMADGVHDLRLPVTIMAGDDDRIVGHEDHPVWLHDRSPAAPSKSSWRSATCCTPRFPPLGKLTPTVKQNSLRLCRPITHISDP